MTRKISPITVALAVALVATVAHPAGAEEAGPRGLPLPIPKPDPEAVFNLTPKAKTQFVDACVADGEPVAVCACLINGIEEYIPPLDFVEFGLAQAEGREPDPAIGARIDRIYQACVTRAESQDPAAPKGEDAPDETPDPPSPPSGDAPQAGADDEAVPPATEAPADAPVGAEQTETSQ